MLDDLRPEHGGEHAARHHQRDGARPVRERRHLGRGAQLFAEVARTVVGPIAHVSTTAPFKAPPAG